MFTTLINAPQLADRMAAKLAEGELVTLDCRFSLTDTEEGARQYRRSHIPGAHYVHLDNDLSSAIVEGDSGRHPLPTQAWFVQQLRHWGVNDNTQVVAYDDAGGAIAARVWWMCRWVGHESSAVLNGGFKSWADQGLPLSSENSKILAGNVAIRPSLAPQVSAAEVLDNITLEKNRLLIDARAPERYSGEVEPLDKLAGHIPDAQNMPFAGNLDKNGRFLSPEALTDRFSSITSADPSGGVIHYCGSGVTAAHNVLAMLHAGLGMTALYAGSWSEWVQDPARPVAQSTTPKSTNTRPS